MRGTGRALATAIAALALALAPGSAGAAEAWTPVNGPVSSAPVTSGHYDLKRIANVPHVAWIDTSGSADVVRVARLSGAGTWEAVGGPASTNANADAGAPSLVAGPGDVPWISWIEQDGDLQRVRVARFDAGTGKWVEVAPGSLINKVHPDYERSMFGAVQTKIVFLEGRAYVVVRQNNPTAYEVDVVSLAADGSSWERLAGPPTQGEPYFSTAHVTGGSLYVATRDFIGGVEVHRLTTAGTWETLGGLANPNPTGEPLPTGSTALAGSGGVIHVLHGQTSDGGTVYVTRFVNGAWELVDGALGEGSASSLRVIGGRLNAGWTAGTGGAQVSRLDGAAWTVPAPLPADAAEAPVLTGVGGVAYAAYRGADGRLRVARLDGSTPGGPDDNDDSEAPKPAPQPPCGKELVGTRFGDRLTGTAGSDLIRGLRGNDTIRGLGGADCLFGDQGADRIEGGDGDDVLEGGDGDDRLTSGAGYDTVRAGSGNDVVDSRGRGFDTIDCGPGRDRALVGDLDRVRNCERVENVD